MLSGRSKNKKRRAITLGFIVFAVAGFAIGLHAQGGSPLGYDLEIPRPCERGHGAFGAKLTLLRFVQQMRP
jgi:hypothetical protein